MHRNNTESTGNMYVKSNDDCRKKVFSTYFLQIMLPLVTQCVVTHVTRHGECDMSRYGINVKIVSTGPIISYTT